MVLNNIQPVFREQNLSIRVADYIEDMIRNGELKAGDKLPPERILCEKFQVSRTVIREATRFLMAKGLLSSHTGHGTFVRNLESSDVANTIGLLIAQQEDMPARAEHLIEVRRALEVQTSRSAAERATESDIEALEKHLLELKKFTNSPEEYAKKDLEFHFLLARATHNPFFEMILSPLMEALLEVIRMALKSEHAVMESTYFHTKITEMIRNRDVKGAGREMANHLSQTQQAVKSAIDRMKEEESNSQKN